jgi:hypothetical protein
MNRIKRFLLARTTILTLILLTLGCMLLGSLIPQSFLLSTQGAVKWQADHPVIAVWAEALGLQHIYGHPLFAALMAAAAGSLLCSVIEQFRLSQRRTFGAELPVASANEFISPFSPETVCSRLRLKHYRQVFAGDQVRRFCLHPWGYWGNFLLHGGMLVVILASLWIALTQQRGVLELAEGESFYPGDRWHAMEKGLLARDLVLDGPVRMESVAYEFWPTFGVKTIASRFKFLSPSSAGEPFTAKVNDILSAHGLRIYQTVDFGHAFYLEVATPTGERKTYQLLLNHPARPENAGYRDFPGLLGQGTVLRAKYYVDPEKRTFARENPQLTLRLEADNRQMGQTPVPAGGEGVIGPYRFRLVKIDKWSSLIFVRLTGMAGVFAGFFIIVIGSILNYFTPPREIVLRAAAAGGTAVSWRASRFGALYRDEFEQLQRELHRETTDE